MFKCVTAVGAWVETFEFLNQCHCPCWEFNYLNSITALTCCKVTLQDMPYLLTDAHTDTVLQALTMLKTSLQEYLTNCPLNELLVCVF